MKNQQTHITRFLIIVAMALISSYNSLTPGWTAGSVGKATSPLPSLRGEAAIGHLKQTGLYHELSAAVTAARYREARMKVAGDEVKLEVGEEGAIYPVTIEPTFTQQQQLQAPDTLECDFSSFGYSVAISGETVVVGALSNNGTGDMDQGAAYVFVRSGGVWTQQQKLTASDADEFDYFGRSVAINGETIVVGAANDDQPYVGIDVGSAYVFVRSGGVWSQQQKLEASDGGEWDYFGASVAISGETVVVGASGDDVWPVSDQGAAYVFVRSGGVWSQQQKLKASDAARGDSFGESVAISGETIVVGAYLDDAGNTSLGSAYVFVRSDGVWSQQQKLTASDAARGDSFGASVAISGETIVVGAFDVIGAFIDEGGPGSAYIFVRSGGVWSQQQKLEASDAAQGDRFGVSVAINGETVVVGASGDDDAELFNRGSAYVFVRSGGVWTQQQKLLVSDMGRSAEIGFSVAISGETVVVGAPNDRFVEDNPQGLAFVFVPVN
jgi:FG-GAP repeat protein